jgi:hypothetical protein
MIFGTTLDGLATRNTVGNERDALETQHCEPRRPLSWPLSGGVKPRRPRSDAYKAPIISFSPQLVCHTLSFSIYLFSPIDGRPVFDGFYALLTTDNYLSQTYL